MNNSEVKKPVCCLCGNECENQFGNNPWPLSKNEEDRCCDICNDTKVIPARLELAKENRENK